MSLSTASRSVGQTMEPCYRIPWTDLIAVYRPVGTRVLAVSTSTRQCADPRYPLTHSLAHPLPARPAVSHMDGRTNGTKHSDN